jgi:glycine cleavage system H protein
MVEVAPKRGELQEGKVWFSRKLSLLTLGLTHAGVEELGEIEGFDLPDDGEDFTKGEVMLTLEGSRGTLEVIAPASGVISESNAAVQDDSTVIEEDPLEEGWLIKVEIEDPAELKEFVSL